MNAIPKPGRGIFRAALVFSLLAFGVMTLGGVQRVSADRDPADCNTNAVGIGLTPLVNGSPTVGPVLEGTEIDYEVTLSLPAGNIPCNFELGQLSVTYPDGTVVQLAGFGGPTSPVPEVTSGAPFAIKPSDVGAALYVAATADEVAGQIVARADYGSTVNQPGQANGEFHSGDAHQVTASATTSNALQVDNPSTDVDASVDLDVIVVGDEVQLTITETNDGDVDLTNPFVDLQPLGLTLDETSPDFSGDDGDGVLEVGETWQWLVTDTPAADTTYIATGHGTAPTGEDVTWCEDVGAPPEGVLCDQDERAEVSVDVTENPSITIVKTAGDAADDTVLEIQPGDLVTFHYHVCNTGDVPLENGVVTDDNGTPADLTDDFTVVVGALDPGECIDVASDPITVPDPPICDSTRLNVGTVVAFSVPLGTEVSDNDDAELCTPENPSITIVKTAGDAADDTVLEIQPGDLVTFHYHVCNTGDVPLENGVVTDDNGTPADLTDDFTVVVPGTLDPGQCVDVDSDPIAIPTPPTCAATRLNIGTVEALSVPAGTEVMASDDAALCTPPVGHEGCTPGYWKVEQHFDSWVPTGYTTGQLLTSVFTLPASLTDAQGETFGDDTLLQALGYGGGPAVDGAARILLRAAVASLLNSASPDVDFTMTTADLIADVNAALASLDRQTMLDLAGELDAANNFGCPLN
jgi:uncharacterized repeat protein (TIGR01451 family)